MKMESGISMTTNEEENKLEISSPTATADGILRRLIRPSALLRSQLEPSSAIASQGEKTMMTTNMKKRKKLEEYLDPGLLAEISNKIGRAKKKVKKDFNEIELNWRKNEAVDLRDDSDPPIFDQESCSTSPFQRLEKISSMIRDFPGK